MILVERGGFGKFQNTFWRSQVAMIKAKTLSVLPSSEPDALKPAKRRYYTISQIANRWGVSAPTVIRLIDEGQLTGLKIRGVYRVTRESIESYERKVAF